MDQAKRLKELEQENSKLKRLVADLSLDKLVLKDIASGKLLSPERRRSAVGHAQQQHGLTERRGVPPGEPATGHASATGRHGAMTKMLSRRPSLSWPAGMAATGTAGSRRC